MAATVADYMREHPDHHMVIIAGGWHVSYGFGIPRRVHRRLPLPYALVGGHNLEIPDEKLDQLMDVQIPNFPMRAVDYLVYQEYEVFKPRGVRLGVMLEDSDDHAGLLVTDRVAGSAAAEAGINKGDRLLRFDGVPLEDSFDLIYAVKSKRPGDSATIELKRGDETLVVEAYFGLEQ
jgi:membrane-associated protease RseP (regulator of RpoE activity)